MTWEGNGQVVLTLESRRSLELPLSRLVIDGSISVYPHVEAKGLIFLQFRRGSVVLTAGRYVGLIPLTPTICLDVRPKLPVLNLSRVLDRARVAIDAIEGVDRLYLAEGAAGSSVLEFLLANLVSAIRPIRHQGVLKEYVRHTTTATHPAGRIKVSPTVQSCMARGIRHRVAVERFEQTTDVAANRVLCGALAYLLRAAAKAGASRELISRGNEAYSALPEQIRGFTSRDYDNARRSVLARSLPPGRSYYYRALEIALLALSGLGISLDAPGGDVTLDSLIVDFERVFEQYLRRTLQLRATPDLLVHDGNGQGKRPLFDDRPEPAAQPDIVVTRQAGGKPVVVEVKYKEKPDRTDINQAITYALAYRSERVVLGHQARPGALTGLRKLGEIDGIRIDAYAFDLGAADLEAEEAAFAATIFSMLQPHQLGAAA